MKRLINAVAILLLAAVPATATSPSSPHAERRIETILGDLLTDVVARTQIVNDQPKDDRLDMAGRPTGIERRADCASTASKEGKNLSPCTNRGKKE